MRFLPSLLRAQPVGYRSRIEADTGANAETGDPTGFGLFEDRDLRDVQDPGEFLCGQGTAHSFDAVGKGQGTPFGHCG